MTKERTSKVRKVGNSLGITIPVQFTRALNLQRGDEVYFSLHASRDLLVHIIKDKEANI